MARPRNEELFNSIKKEAYRQLMTRGYKDTTYQSIASACGVTRAAVQNYYSSKLELSLAFYYDLLGVIHEIVQEKQLHQDSEFDFMFCIGQCFFAYLMQDDGSRKFLEESVGNRDITEETMDFEYQWGVKFLSTSLTVTEEKFHEDVLVSMGGFYTLLYKYLKDNVPIDIPTHLGRVVRTIMHDYGYSYDDAKAYIASHAMTPAEADPVLTEVAKRMEL